MKSFKYFFLTPFLLVCLSLASFAQDIQIDDPPIQKKNVIRYNLTPSVLGFKSYIFGYERMVRPYQSFSINFGYLALGQDGETVNDTYDFVKSKSSNGFSLVADYRFYLKKENKFQAPRGVYIGPYFASYFLKSNITLRSTDASIGNPEVDVDIKLNNQNLGMELGYQFLIKNRITIDLVLVGPSLSLYNFKLGSSGNLDLNDEEVEEAITTAKDILLEKYPWVKKLFNEDGIAVKESKSIWSFGYRYVFQIGYNF